MLERSCNFERFLEGVQQSFDGLKTTARILLQCAKYHMLNRTLKGGIEKGRSKWFRFPLMLADHLIACSIEWQIAGKHLVEKDTHRVYLTTHIHLAFENFRSNKMRSSQHMSIVSWLFTEPGHNAKVG